ncbi:MAG: methyltransferase domain-containing protein [Alphaproteobacteria bacterium]|nr:methyltransferase domain-containing protein [Alphaproteobacteria bacterium]MBV8413509.1 methyltransferase domain-containing protein [Alphaproteobacteria bacterium]
MSDTAEIVQHYGDGDIRDRLEQALARAGLGEGRLSSSDLAPLDQFHTRGLAATVELAQAAAIEAGAEIVDVGSGLGGASRYLAATFDCRVHGIDLSPAFVAAASYLAERAGLAGKVTYQSADALAMPFASGRFDLAWTQHVAMNIADRACLYGEVHRVVRPGGRFAIYDVVAGNAGPLHFPVPWSRGPETSFLVAPDAMRRTLEQAGFKVIDWQDKSETGVAWFAEQQKARAAAQGNAAQASNAARASLGLHLAMGPDFPLMAANLGRNLGERRVGLIQAVLERS